MKVLVCGIFGKQQRLIEGDKWQVNIVFIEAPKSGRELENLMAKCDLSLMNIKFARHYQTHVAQRSNTPAVFYSGGISSLRKLLEVIEACKTQQEAYDAAAKSEFNGRSA